MKLNEFLRNDRGVSPVVGVALLIAITVILAAVIGGVVLGLGTGGVETPQAQMQAAFSDSNGDDTMDTVEITHNGGEPLPDDHIVVVLEGTFGGAAGEVNADLSEGGVDDGGALEAGNSVTFDSSHGDIANTDDIESVTILWDDPNSDSTTVLEEFEA